MRLVVTPLPIAEPLHGGGGHFLPTAARPTSLPCPPNMPDLQRPASKDMANGRNPADKALRQPRGSPENCCLRPRDWCGHVNEANEEEEEEEEDPVSPCDWDRWNCGRGP